MAPDDRPFLTSVAVGIRRRSAHGADEGAVSSDQCALRNCQPLARCCASPVKNPLSRTVFPARSTRTSCQDAATIARPGASASIRGESPHVSSMWAIICSRSRIPRVAASPDEKTRRPLSAMKNAAVSANYVRHAAGPRCDTPAATLSAKTRALSAIAAASAADMADGARERSQPASDRANTAGSDLRRAVMRGYFFPFSSTSDTMKPKAGHPPD